MQRRRLIGLAGAVTAVAGLAAWARRAGSTVSAATLLDAHHETLPVPAGPVATDHLGHSLVGPDMPAMLAAAAGHRWHAQTGWGTSLRNHWEGEVNGLSSGATHRDPRDALASGEYGAVVFTEMVELRDALRWHEPGKTLARWADLAKAGNTAVRLHLYETWHRLDDPDGWEARIAGDRAALWEAGLLRPALAKGHLLHVIPGGALLAAAVGAAERGDLPGITSRHEFFSDEIHLSDLGSWTIAMLHYACLYRRSPEGLAARLPRGDGTLAGAPEDAAAALQALAWKIASDDPLSGIRGSGA